MKYIWYFIFVLLIYISLSTVMKAKDIIPKEAIRIRVIANSNNEEDIIMKEKVVNILSKILFKVISHT